MQPADLCQWYEQSSPTDLCVNFVDNHLLLQQPCHNDGGQSCIGWLTPLRVAAIHSSS